MQQQEHVSEEAAKMAKIQGQEGPDMEAGTPIQEVMVEEKETRKDAPEVVKEDLEKGKTNVQPNTEVGGSQKRSFSTFARRRLEVEGTSSGAGLPDHMIPSAEERARFAENQQSTTSVTETVQQLQRPGLKFPAPTQPPTNMKERHDPIIIQFTNLLMRDGKKSVAEKHVAHILNALRTLPSPTYSTKHPLLPGAPPASHLPLNPILYLTLAIDSVAPLLRIRSQRGAAGGGVALQIPVPLGLRQRRRQAMTWIIDAASKKGNREGFAQRVATEIVAVVEGRSAVWEKRVAVHRLGTSARSSLMFGRRR